MYDAILVATDGSDDANRAVKVGVDLATQYGATLHAISVVDTGRYSEPAFSSSELIVDELEKNAEQLLEAVEDEAEKAGLEVATRACHGDPHREIVDYADDVDADVLILGSHGTSITGHHIGSVADRVVRETDRQVMLV